MLRIISECMAQAIGKSPCSTIHRMRGTIRLMLELVLKINPARVKALLRHYQALRSNLIQVSYSQGGEDLALLNLIKKSNGRYLDIGAHDPDRFSNTKLLYERGWFGVNVEANPSLIPAFSENRLRDLTLSAAVGPQKEYKFYLFEEPALSTYNEEYKNLCIQQDQKVSSCIKVKGVTLFELIKQYFFDGNLDLLLVDTEGSDYDVILSGNFGSLPRNLLPDWICVETHGNVEKALSYDSVRLIKSYGYSVQSVLVMSTILRKEFQ